MSRDLSRMKIQSEIRGFLSAVFFLFASPVFALEFTDADIVIPENASDYMKFTAGELSHHLKKITGGRFNITAAPRTEVKILLGEAPAGFDREKLAERNSFVIAADKSSVYIAGLDTCVPSGETPYNMLTEPRKSRGTLMGVYTFLEDQGVRWLAPGEANTYIPAKTSIRVPEKVMVTVPRVKGRNIAELYNFGQAFGKKDANEYFSSPEAYAGHLWALRHRYAFYPIAGAHSEQMLKLGLLWKDHPERFQLMKNGKRNTRYLCWTDPAVMAIWKKAADAYFSGKTPAEAGFVHTRNWRALGIAETFFIDPMDHGASNDGRCWCERCQAFRRKISCPDDSEIIWRVIAGVAEMVGKKYPGKYVGTLIYPPKQHIPQTVKIPKNLNVMLCLSGPKSVNDAAKMKAQLDQLREWNRMLGRDHVSVWTYQCELFGGKLPGVPEWYPDYFQRYFQQVMPYVCNIFHEYHSHNLTYRIHESYLQLRLLWNPDLDLKQAADEHIRLYYGPAAGIMGELTARMENNFKRYQHEICHVSDPSSQIGIYRNFRPLKKIAWGKVYTKQEMEYIDNALLKAEKAAGNSIYAKRVRLFRQYIYDFMVKERSEVMDLADSALRLTLSDAPWSDQKSYRMVSAHKDGTKLTSETRCQFRLDGDVLHIRLTSDEPRMDAVKITPSMKDGDPNLWTDYVWDFFFYTPADNTVRQYIVSAGNKCTGVVYSPGSIRYTAAPEVKYMIAKNKQGFTVDFSIPIAALGENARGFKFNVTRERNLVKLPAEYSTLSSPACLGSWLNSDCFVQVK